MLGSYVKGNHRKWDENLSAICCAIRTSKHETTGYTPYFTNFGREYVPSGSVFSGYLNNPDNVPPDVERRRQGFQKVFDKIRTRIAASRERSRMVYNLRRRPVHFNVGDRVWVYFPTQLVPLVLN